MKYSEQIDLIAKALVGVQSEITDAIKDTKAHKYKYADLTQILDILRPLLTKYNLSVNQHPGVADNKVMIETVILHESGQWMSSVLEMPSSPVASMSPAQAVGSVITYGRRYALSAIFGISQADDDAATHVVVTQAKRPPNDTPIQSDKVQQNASVGNRIEPISRAQVDEIDRLIQETDTDAVRLLTYFKVNSYSEMNQSDYEKCKHMLEVKLNSKG